MPIGFSNFSDALRAGTEVFHNLKQILSDKGYSVAVGDEGGFAPDVNNLDDALANISDAIEKSGYKLGEQIYIAIDAAASELFDGQNYFLKGENKKLNTDQLVKYWEDLCKKFPVISIEDPFDENDWNGFKELTKKIGKNVQIVGDDLFVTNKNRLLTCLLYTSPSPRDATLSRMPSSA